MKRIYQTAIVITILIMFILIHKDIHEVKELVRDEKMQAPTIWEKQEEEKPKYENPTRTRIEEFDTEEQINEEIRLGEMELLAQLVEAEAGNQDMYGKRLVADVVLNRVADADFPNTIEEVIHQKLGNTYMFSSVGDGNFDRAGWIISQDSFKAAQMEYETENCTDMADCGYHLIYFRTGRYSDYGTPLFKHGHIISVQSEVYMKCPYCGKDNNRCIDTYYSDNKRMQYRRRNCLSCGERFSMHERYVPDWLDERGGKKGTSRIYRGERW